MGRDGRNGLSPRLRTSSQALRESEIIRLAQAEAERIVRKPAGRPYEMESGAKTYAKKLLEILQKSLAENLSVVENGLQHLEQME